MLLLIAASGELVGERSVFEGEDQTDVMTRCWAMLRHADPQSHDVPPGLRLI